VKFITLLFCLCLLSVPGTSQNFKSSRNVDDLKSQLPHLTGVDKLECLNRIAFLYISIRQPQPDSGLVYCKQAFEYAKQVKGMKKFFIAANQYARVLLQNSRADEGLQYYRIALNAADEMQNDTMKAIACRGIGRALYYKSKFQDAVDTMKLAINYFQKFESVGEVADAKMVISNIYGDQGNYEEAFEASLEALRLNESLGDDDNTVLALAQLGDIFRNVGDVESALEYYRRAFSLAPDEDGWSFRHLSNCIGNLYCDLQKYDSAYIFYTRGLSGDPKSKTSRLRLAEYYLLRKSYDTSMRYFSGLYDELKNSGEGNILVNTVLGMGKIAYAQNDLTQAFSYARHALQIGELQGTKKVIRDACKLLSSLNEKVGQTDSAFFYYRKYVEIKDAVVTDQFKGKLYAYRRTSEDQKKLEQISYLEKQKRIDRRFTRILIGVIVLLCFLTFILIRNSKLRRRNTTLQTARIEAEWQRRAGELEMQALRAQMNPHFIFNCLSSINKFILKNEPDKASDYLTRFSRLIRLVLVNSQKPLIMLEDEVEMLRLYIDMEKLRFKNSFDYSITYTRDIEPSNIFIPPLLLQPFCENAIWHGLMHKDGLGQLDIFFEMNNDMVVCTITDNGIGRTKASEIKSKSAERIKSLGLKLTAERLALFNEGKSVHTFYKMEDVIEGGAIAGTRVKVNIKYKQGIDEHVEMANND
jgi:tetratricopeptide (TPR) repeat protein